MIKSKEEPFKIRTSHFILDDIVGIKPINSQTPSYSNKDNITGFIKNPDGRIA